MAVARVIQSRSPQNPSIVVGEWSDDGPEAVGPVVERATKALPEWAGAGPTLKAKALSDAAGTLERRSEEAAGLIVREVGKPAGEAAAEVARTVSILRYYAQAAFDASGEAFPTADGSLLLSRRRPRGVVALVTPWNFPFAIPTWKLAPALTWGNSVVLKPASDAMACADF